MPFQVGTYYKKAERWALVTEHEIQDKDIIIMFTNGVSENLLDHQHFVPEEEVENTLLNELVDICVRPHMKGKNLEDA